MPYNRNESTFKATALHGAAALKELLDNIGRQDGDDHKVAKALTENEMPLRALLTYSLDKFCNEI